MVMPSLNIKLTQRIVLLLVPVAGLAMLLLLIGLAILQTRRFLDAAYPGAQQLSANNSRELLPNPVVRSTTSYRTTASYPDVLRWYNEKFGLGIVRVGLQKCTHSYSQNAQLGISYDVAVTVCDSATGRLIFVERTAMLRCQAWYCP